MAGLTINYEGDSGADIADYVLKSVVGWHVELSYEDGAVTETVEGNLDEYLHEKATVSESGYKDGTYARTGRVVTVPLHAIREVTVP